MKDSAHYVGVRMEEMGHNILALVQATPYVLNRERSLTERTFCHLGYCVCVCMVGK